MQSHPRQLLVYQTEEEDDPFLTWLDSLRDRASRARIKKRLDRVELGNIGDYRSVGDGVFELKIDCGSGYRVYFGNVDLETILILFGGDKGTQEEDILRAKQFWEDFKKRENNSE
jgi:putative addiction module killer protein